MDKNLEEKIKNIYLNIYCNLFVHKNMENIVIIFIIEIQDTQFGCKDNF